MQCALCRLDQELNEFINRTENLEECKMEQSNRYMKNIELGEEISIKQSTFKAICERLFEKENERRGVGGKGKESSAECSAGAQRSETLCITWEKQDCSSSELQRHAPTLVNQLFDWWKQLHELVSTLSASSSHWEVPRRPRRAYISTACSPSSLFVLYMHTLYLPAPGFITCL